jgi:hypothetical protein
MAASEAAMKLAKPAGSAHLMPKPRLPMKSWNSFDSFAFFSDATTFAEMSAGRPLGAAMPRQAPTE